MLARILNENEKSCVLVEFKLFYVHVNKVIIFQKNHAGDHGRESSLS